MYNPAHEERKALSVTHELVGTVTGFSPETHRFNLQISLRGERCSIPAQVYSYKERCNQDICAWQYLALVATCAPDDPLVRHLSFAKSLENESRFFGWFDDAHIFQIAIIANDRTAPGWRRMWNSNLDETRNTESNR